MNAVFVDKDGTLVVDVPYNADPNRVRLTENATQGLKRLRAAGFGVFVVSNQPGVGLGYFGGDALQAMYRHIRRLLREGGTDLDGFYYCPHREQDACGCRKPQPGLLQAAAADYDIDLQRSWLIGDILHDVEAGRRVGCRTVLIDNGNETEWRDGPLRRPHYRAYDLSEAATCILEEIHE